MQNTADPLSNDRIKLETQAPIRKDYRNPNDKSETKVNKEDYLTEDKRFKKGNPGRPKGSHRGYTLKDLTKAIKRVEKKRGKKYFEEMIEQSYSEPSIFIAILKRLVAEQKLDESDSIKIINIIRSGNSPEPKQSEGDKPDAKI